MTRVQIVSQLLGGKLEKENSAKSTHALNILDSPSKRPKDTGTDCVADTSNSSELLNMLSVSTATPLQNAILSGNGIKLKELLSQYTCPVQCIRFLGISVIEFAYFVLQIGIVRILVNEYGIDANISDDTGYPSFYKMFEGNNSTKVSQSLIIIQCIKEFNIDVHKQGEFFSALDLALLLKLFTVVKFLVEECKVDVNHTAKRVGGTPLHIAYGIGEESIAKYLIKHGADQEAIDDHGRKPRDCEFYESNIYYTISKCYLKQREIIKNYGPEADYWLECQEQGLSLVEAVDATFDKFPNLQKSTVGSSSVVLETTPTLNELNRYITDMAEYYYEIGLQLGIDNRKLKLIKNDHVSFSGFEQKCHGMLEIWLDTSATWKKLCDALERLKLNFLAGKIKDASR